MFALRRKAVQTAGRRPAATSTVSRLYSTGQHGKTGDEVHHFAGSSQEHGEHHAGPENESLGTGFFVVLAAIPLSIGLYSVSRPDKDGKPAGLSRFIDSFSHYKEKWATQNTLHVQAIEQAAYNRNVDQNATPSMHIDLRFPEIFNTGSPYNVIAGQGPRNMDALVAHYQKQNTDEDERRAKALAAKQNNTRT
ncbi:NADH-ubiquinone oxidoreductase 17.8 kDa subunit [Glarea lozoyensis ATCC 20868]|uniref:NADH-ubiquinone oxidoreductase 17.8 kDa subunit n=1 Tax=Glarea lozoyensis (strain ATCC 20868 / MF5171) TaxID=1116229 RepID=S3DX97_GLAL2|nr:NADH-ubiquinone oxidoreductase 17.8 kDa subunit [Glarea lozoyensis ATCC 20868]EPE36581.1 NADH-ubiquinone oxidoreductase 17.8 kDa subunit [Glarea lozoyensis ATCC 20868]